MAEGLAVCPSCGAPVKPPAASFRAPSPRIEDDPAMRMLLPVGRSGWAIAAGYLGLFSVSLVFGPLAILTGILALRDIGAHPDKLGKGRAIFGIIMGLLGTLGLIWFVTALTFNK